MTLHVPQRAMYGIAAGCLLVTIVGFVQWLRLQMRLGMGYQAAKAGVPYQNINLRAADAVNRISNEWLLLAVVAFLVAAGVLMMTIRLKAPDAQARNFWAGPTR